MPGVHPYVLMNYTGDRRSILTLAHELGHGLHGVLAQPLGLFNASTPLTMAETASVFGESLTFRSLMQAETDPRRRLDLLAGRIEDAIATTWRQITMNRFEHAVHTGRREGASCRRTPSRRRGSRRRRRSSTTRRHDRVRRLVELRAPLPVRAGLRLRLRLRLPLLARDLPALRAGGRGDRRAVLRAASERRLEAPERLAEIVGLDLTDPAIWASGIEALDELLGEAEALADEAL